MNAIKGLDYDHDNDCGLGYRDSFEKEIKRREELKHYISDVMKEGVDYGNLPNTSKKCLFKSGAEKLCMLYRLAPLYEVTSRTEDFSQGLFSYEVKVILKDKDTGMTVAEGAGNCSSFESKYQKQDKYNIQNTVLKMSKKRAYVDAALIATGSSDIFTQDMESDVIKGEVHDNSKERMGESTEERTVRGATISMASQRQTSYIYKLLSGKNISLADSRSHLMSRYNKQDVSMLTKSEASEYIEYLNNYTQERKAS